MTDLELRALGLECYAAFNSTAPAASSQAWSLWAEVCRQVPLKAAPWIRGKMLERETAPRNFGKAVLDLYADWPGKHEHARRTAAPCPDCDVLPGFFYWWRRAPSGHLYTGMFRCMCNTNAYYDPMPRRSKEQAEKEGYSVMPRGYPGGWAAYMSALLAEGL